MLHFPVAGMNAVVGMVGLVDLLTWSHCIVGTFSTEMSGVSAGKISAGKTKFWPHGVSRGGTKNAVVLESKEAQRVV